MRGATVWRHGAADAPAPGTAEAVIALDAALPGGLARDALVYLTGAQAAALSAPSPAPRRFLVLDAPDLIAEAVDGGLPPVEAHAARAARVLAAALAEAGRDLTRTRLVAALSRADLGREGLDYARLPLAGTDHVSILALSAGP